MFQTLAVNVAEAYYRLEPFLKTALAAFVRQHLDTYAEQEDGSPKEFWVSFYNLEVRRLTSAKEVTSYQPCAHARVSSLHAIRTHTCTEVAPLSSFSKETGCGSCAPIRSGS